MIWLNLTGMTVLCQPIMEKDKKSLKLKSLNCDEKKEYCTILCFFLFESSGNNSEIEQN